MDSTLLFNANGLLDWRIAQGVKELQYSVEFLGGHKVLFISDPGMFAEEAIQEYDREYARSQYECSIWDVDTLSDEEMAWYSIVDEFSHEHMAEEDTMVVVPMELVS